MEDGRALSETARPSATVSNFGTQRGRAGRFAVGGLIGYDFGKFTV
ncbi:hypothetical protein HCU64_23120 [Methylobacterium sp. C25]|nr:hypothetical protein [Methylobacterium sp. C25]MCE4226637.1 hypothetical protein [Methylobacterium sp. C25]